VQQITFVDAFTDQAFGGNPAAVCLLEGTREDHWLQALAREMNKPATAYLWQRAVGWELRWFSPTTELALCGHGTLSAAHALWDEGLLAPDEAACFHSPAGPLTASRREGWIELDFAAEPEAAAEPPAALLRALGATPSYTGRNRLDYLVELESEQAVRTLRPDLALLGTVETRGVIVTARAAMPDFDFVSRFFAPRAGAVEDFVTGSAHLCLGPFWAERLGKTSLTGFQASSRGGEVRVRAQGERVCIAGQAVTVGRAQIRA
jgi:PhzF family phenazine biosynthesis protein